MSDLFGGSAQPSWMAPEQRDSILTREGLEIAQSFNTAFQSAFSRKQEEGYKIAGEKRAEDRQKKEMDEYKKRMDAFLSAVHGETGTAPAQPSSPGVSDEAWKLPDQGPLTLSGNDDWQKSKAAFEQQSFEPSEGVAQPQPMPSKPSDYKGDPSYEQGGAAQYESSPPKYKKTDGTFTTSPPSGGLPTFGSATTPSPPLVKKFEPKDAFDFIGKHPEWLMDPYIGKHVQDWLTAEGNMMKIQNQADALKVRADTAKITADREKGNNAFDAFVSGQNNPGKTSRIAALPNQGYVVDENKRRIAPSQEALAIADEGLPKEETFAFKSNPVLSAKAREEAKTTNLGKLIKERDAAEAEGRDDDVKAYDDQIKKLNVSPMDLERAREDARATRQKAAIDAKAELQKQAGKFKIDLATKQAELRAQEKAGKKETEQEFVGKHFSSTYNSVLKNWDTSISKTPDPDKAEAIAMSILKRAYKQSQLNTPKPAASSPVKVYDPATDSFK